MTKEEAIMILLHGFPFNPFTVEHINEACRIGAKALRAQQGIPPLDRSRRKGCNWCNEYGFVAAAFDGWRYCNRCGRPLTEEAWAELERRINDGTIDL